VPPGGPRTGSGSVVNNSKGGDLKGGRRQPPPLDVAREVWYDLYQVRSEVTPNIMACTRGGQGGRCTRCGAIHPYQRGSKGDRETICTTAAKVKAVKEHARKKAAAAQRRMSL